MRRKENEDDEKKGRERKKRHDMSPMWVFVFVVKLCCSSLFTIHIFFLHSLPLHSLMVKCLLRQVVIWSSSPRWILSSLPKPYNCSCSHTYIYKRALLLFQQQHTRVQTKQYVHVYIKKLTTEKKDIHNVCLFLSLKNIL
jgi:hypothetical protein